jgi:hypothetical protein
VAGGLPLNQLFKLAFGTLLILTVVLFATGVAYSVLIPNPTTSQAEAESNLFQSASYTLTALVGLFLGRVA